MASQQSFRNISKRASQLLKMEEGYDVDFKFNAEGIKNEDLVAFANSDRGGAVLLGVDEVEQADGRKLGRVVGCKIGDEPKQRILNLANDCTPPIHVEIFSENTGGKAFLRVEIPSSQSKPHCTKKGLYLTRFDARNIALTPSQLLRVFEESESYRFLKRFREATETLQCSIDDMSLEFKQKIEWLLIETTDATSQIEHLLSGLDFMLDEKLRDIFQRADEASDSAAEAMDYSEDAAERTRLIQDDLTGTWYSLPEIAKRTLALLNHFGIEDPSVAEARMMTKASLRCLLTLTTAPTKEEYLKNARESGICNRDFLGQLYDEVADEVKDLPKITPPYAASTKPKKKGRQSELSPKRKVKKTAASMNTAKKNTNRKKS